MDFTYTGSQSMRGGVDIRLFKYCFVGVKKQNSFGWNDSDKKEISFFWLSAMKTGKTEI